MYSSIAIKLKPYIFNVSMKWLFPLVRCKSSVTMRVLNVAEKNDAAKNIAGLLSNGSCTRREGLSTYNKIYEFDYSLNGQNCKMIMTSVAGHLLNYEFSSNYRSWSSCSPSALFDAPVSKQCPPDYQNIKKTLEREVRSCNKLIIWTDCDREGENIGFEIIEVCRQIKSNLPVLRAKFSEITRQSISRAMETLGEPNKNVSDAVDVRQQLDLRIGAAFTRLQTLHLKQTFPTALGDALISYGSCQFPTLGFVVERYKSIVNFISEKFWKIKVTDTRDNVSVEFIWQRIRLFDQLACEVIYDTCMENPTAKVESVQSKPKSKWRPRPLDTVEMEKIVSRKLRINAKETMRIAEKLYTQGFISYPRTETNIFPKELNLRPLVEQQAQDAQWGEFAQKVLSDGPNPFQGNKSDQAHPPIHPTKYTNSLQGQEKRLYEFIVRHFLACLSKHAEGLETVVDIDIADEKFTAKGLMIIARNYLEVYPYDKWSDKEMHIYQQGDVFYPTIEMTDGDTSAPDLLTEADLIALMEKHGIGTDATHAEHIEKVKTRLYVGLKDEKFFVPKTLGMGLVDGYDSMGFEMSKPRLRAELEGDLKKICEGVKNADDVLTSQIEKYRETFEAAQTQISLLDRAMQEYLKIQPTNVGTTGFQNGSFPQIQEVGKCPRCESKFTLKRRNNENSQSGGKWFIGCDAFPGCREAIWFPSFVIDCNLTNDTCNICGPPFKLLQFKFQPGNCYLPSNYTGCIGGCDSILLEALNAGGDRQVNRVQQSQPLSNYHNSGSQNHRNDSGFVSNATNNATVSCNCGKPAVQLTVRKEGRNCGRQFYKCDAPRGTTSTCDFFKWADNIDPGVSGEPENGGGTQSRGGGVISQNFFSADDIHCHCGKEAKRLTVMKEGPNKGRSFFTCEKPMGHNDKCTFFQWADEQSNSSSNNPFQNQHGVSNMNTNSYNANNSRRGRGGTSRGGRKRSSNQESGQPKKRKCGLCGIEG